jgi:hypothetical protein
MIAVNKFHSLDDHAFGSLNTAHCATAKNWPVFALWEL